MSDHDSEAASRASALLDALRAEAAAAGALPELDPDTYARTHAPFEARSDQRSRIVEWLSARNLPRDRPQVSVLSVGCGDGAADAAVARYLLDADPARHVRYVGVEPFAGSAAAFAERLGAIDAGGRLEVETQVAGFDDAELTESFDLVTFVHSMYYVPDVAKAGVAAHDLLRPGGQLAVLSAPRGALNQLATAVAPPVEGHRQWFSDDVADGFDRAGLVVERDHIDARVDLADADDGVLDFTVQAVLTPTMRALVREYLVAVAVPGTAATVPHPVDTFVVRAEA